MLGADSKFEFDGGVAVVTGAASGLGRAIAAACCARRMRLALADVNAPALDEVTASLARATDCLSRALDVRDRAQLEALADAVFARFGRVDLLFNNAGVFVSRPLLETSDADWRWMLDVNLWSVIHGVAAFVPRMTAQPGESRVINTASAAGFLAEPYLGAYAVSKHAVVALSETLDAELRLQGAKVGVTVLSPAFVPTGIVDSERARPQEIAAAQPAPLSPVARAAREQFEKAIRSGKITADDVAAQVLEGIGRRRLHVFTHPKIRTAVDARLTAVYEGFKP